MIDGNTLDLSSNAEKVLKEYVKEKGNILLAVSSLYGDIIKTANEKDSRLDDWVCSLFEVISIKYKDPFALPSYFLTIPIEVPALKKSLKVAYSSFPWIENLYDITLNRAAILDNEYAYSYILKRYEGNWAYFICSFFYQDDINILFYPSNSLSILEEQFSHNLLLPGENHYSFSSFKQYVDRHIKTKTNLNIEILKRIYSPKYETLYQIDDSSIARETRKALKNNVVINQIGGKDEQRNK